MFLNKPEVNYQQLSENLGGYPVWMGDLFPKNLELIETELTSLFKKLKSENVFKQNDKWKSHLLSDITFKENLIEKYNLEKVKFIIELYINRWQFFLRAPKYKVKFTSSWFTITNKDKYAHIHNHGESDISGVFYLKTNGKDGNLFFPYSNIHLKNNKFFRQTNISKPFDVEPKVGRMILFPGSLEHGVRTNDTDNERVSFSFNIVFEDKNYTNEEISKFQTHYKESVI